MRVGLNPYGLTWMLGLQGRGTPRANPAGRGLEGFLAIADELGARVVEIFDPWLQAMPDAARRAPSATASPTHGHDAGRQRRHRHDGADRGAPSARRASSAPRTIRLGLSPVLCGDRNACGRRSGPTLNATHPRRRSREWGPRADDAGYRFAHREPPGLHQRRAGRLLRGASRGVGITLRHRQHLPGRRGAARLHPHASRRTSSTSISRTTASSSPTRATASSAAPSATARCRSPRCCRDPRPRTTRRSPRCSSPARSRRGTSGSSPPDWWNGYAPKTRGGARRLPRAPRGSTGCPTTPTTARRGSAARTARWTPTSST